MSNQFVSLTVPTGDGVGAITDVSLMGRNKTIAILGEFNGNLIIEGSLNGSVFSTVFRVAGSTVGPDGLVFPLVGTFDEMRIRRTQTTTGAPTVTIGSPEPGGGSGGDGYIFVNNTELSGDSATMAVINLDGNEDQFYLLKGQCIFTGVGDSGDVVIRPNANIVSDFFGRAEVANGAIQVVNGVGAIIARIPAIPLDEIFNFECYVWARTTTKGGVSVRMRNFHSRGVSSDPNGVIVPVLYEGWSTWAEDVSNITQLTVHTLNTLQMAEGSHLEIYKLLDGG